MKQFIVDNDVHIRSAQTTAKMMKHLMIALLPIILFSLYIKAVVPYINGDSDIVTMLYPFALILVAMVTAVITEAIYARLILRYKKKDLKTYLKHSSATLPGLLLAILVPIDTPIYILMLGVFVATLFGKMLFGGFGKNRFNPALVGYLFLFIVFPSVFVSNNITPLENLASLDFVGSYNEVVAPYGNLWDLFLGFKTSAEVSILLCLLALIYLTYFKVIKTKIPVIMISTVFVMAALIGYFNNMELWYPIFSVLTGWTVFAAIFIATDPVTSPVTNVGQIIYGVLLGTLIIVFRYFTPYPDGILLAILIMNGLVILIDKLGARMRFDYYKAVLIIFIPIAIMVGVALYTSSTLISADVAVIDKNFKVISKERDNNFIYYVVTEKCFNLVKAKITLNKSGVITAILVLENSEPAYDEIIKADYINKIIANQDDLSKLKTITVAKRTSDGFKQMVNNTLLDYKNNEI